MTTISVPISDDVVKYTPVPVPTMSTNTSYFKEDWFDNALVNNGYKDYFMVDPILEEGHNNINKFNNVIKL